MFLIGWHKSPGGLITRTGTAIAKRAYTIQPNANPAVGKLTPASAPAEIYLQDQPVPPQKDVDGNVMITFESDLVADKPHADLIFLPSLPNQAEEVQVNGTTWLRRPATVTGPMAFGWERKDRAPRLDESGIQAHPNERPLPAVFNNRFYNGYRRACRESVSVAGPPYLSKGSNIRLVRSGLSDYGFTLGSETVAGTIYRFSGIGKDLEARWQPRTLDFHLDTLEVEPDQNRCTVVWRGVWEFNDILEANYRKLVVTMN
jgi:hypothetical protein